MDPPARAVEKVVHRLATRGRRNLPGARTPYSAWYTNVCRRVYQPCLLWVVRYRLPQILADSSSPVDRSDVGCGDWCTYIFLQQYSVSECSMPCCYICEPDRIFPTCSDPSKHTIEYVGAKYPARITPSGGTTGHMVTKRICSSSSTS